MSGQQCGLAGSILLSQVDVIVWFVPYFTPLLLFYFISSPQIFHSNCFLQQWSLLCSAHESQSTFFIAWGQMALLKPNIFRNLFL